MAADALPQPRQTLAIIAVLSAMTLVVLDAGIANLALPSLAGALAITPARAVLVVTVYQAGLVMALLPCSALGERFGYRRVFAVGVGLFVIASALCAVSPSLAWLAAARLVQGLGGAAVMALGVALLRFSVRQDRLGAAIGWNALTVALASAAAPSLGALILSAAGWRWIYALNLPLGAITLVAALALPKVAAAGRGLDLISIALNAAMFGALIVAAELAPSSPAMAALLLAIAAFSLAMLVRRETPKAAPLIPLDLLGGRPFRISAIASICCFTGQTAGLLALAFHLQHNLHQSPVTAGLYLTAWPLSVAAIATVVGRLADRFPAAWLCAIGGLGLALGLAGAAMWPVQAEPRLFIVFAAVSGLGFGLFQTPNNRNMFLSAPPERSGAAGGMQGTARLTGQAAGAVLMTMIFHAAAIETAPRIALGMAAALTMAAGLVSLLGRRAAMPRPIVTPPASELEQPAPMAQSSMQRARGIARP